MGLTGDREGFLRRCVLAASIAFVLAAFSAASLAGPAAADAGPAQAAKKCKKGKKKKCKKKKAPAPSVPAPVVTPPVPAPDTDGDGVPNATDNCPGVSNTGQADADADGAGDACDVCPNDANTTTCSVDDPNDLDDDGWLNPSDNCPDVANPDQLDSDDDMKGNACDPCPADANPGSQGCPTTIYKINDGTIPSGQQVRLPFVLVTAVMADDSAAWIQVKSGDPGDQGRDYSGLEVSLAGLSPAPDLSAGDRVTIDGIAGAQSLTATGVTETGIDIPSSRSLSSATFTDPGMTPALNGSLVTVASVTLSSHDGNGEWVTSGGFKVGKRIIGSLPTCSDGTSITVTGIADLVGGSLVLLPRSVNDIYGCPVHLTSVNLGADWVCVGQNGVGTVTLSGPALGDTNVALSSDSAGLAVPSLVTVPNGQASKTFSYQAVSEGNATVTAQLSLESVQDELAILAASACDP